MKKILAFTLTLMLLVGMLGCTAKTDAPTDQSAVYAGTFRVGFGRSFITPEENLPLGGYGTSSTRIMNDVLDDTFVTTIAMTDENDYTVLLMLVDLQRIEDSLIDMLRMSVTGATGIPGSQIIITCSHTHSIPDLLLDSHEGIARYKQLLLERFAESAAAAMEDRLPATMYTGSIEAQGLNFVKHYQYVDENGVVQYFGDNFGTATMDATTQHVTEAYDAMHLLQFKREGGKDIIISNFRSHPTITGGATLLDLSSDFIGPMREIVETELDCHFAFMQGACGNINPRSRISGENVVLDKNHRDYGNRLAQVALEGIETAMEQQETGKLQSEQIIYSAKVDHSQDHLLPYVPLVQEYHKQNGGDHAATRAYGAPYGISSNYHAGAIRIKSKLAQTQDIELSTISIGTSVGFFAAPGELFDQVSVEMEASSPFKMTFTIGFADGDWKYFPYGPCAEYASYESDYGRFEYNTAVGMMQAWNTSLEALYEGAE